MRVSPLPDRDRRHLLQFHVFPSMAYGPRLGVAIPSIVAGLAIQAISPFDGASLAASFILIGLGNVLLLIKGYDARPVAKIRARDGKDTGDWEKTTRERFRAVRDLERSALRWDRTFSDITCVPGCLTLILLAGGVAVGFGVLSASPGLDSLAVVFAGDCAVLLLPHWLTGLRFMWRPVALSQQVAALETALEVIDKQSAPPCQVQPMFLTASAGEQGGAVPLAARVFIRFPDASGDFLGVQFQVALNDVQGTKYPYLYAVLVARHPFGLLDREKPAAAGSTRLTMEGKHESEVDVLVIRQYTTRQSGYHTKAGAIRDIAQTAWDAAARLAG